MALQSSSSASTEFANGAAHHHTPLLPLRSTSQAPLLSTASSGPHTTLSSNGSADTLRPDDHGANGSATRLSLQMPTGALSTPPPRINTTTANATEDGGYHMRHGWDSQYSVEQLRELTTNFYMYFGEKRHDTGGKPKEKINKAASQDWRMKDRLKTVSALLPICLNIGTDPPDIFKTNPSAKLECWVDPTSINASGASTNTIMKQIEKALQSQYEQLSMRTRYKVLPDPTLDELKKYAISVRKNAKEERILFHFNGHGVPKPTPSGEIWVFNKTYTQYIPVSIFDLQSWLGAPSILVYDSTNAGLIIKNFNKFVDKHNLQNAEERRRDPAAQVMNFSDSIQLAACSEEETLPTNPLLPADLFTCCLTTPIEIAVRFYIMKCPLRKDISFEDAAKIPGRAQERRTPIGELNWIFTAITDTIAWNTLPKPIFKRLFRQDLMVAALFRNFLLAQRIMRAFHCHPQSFPQIPSTHDHPLWDSWDLAVELVLSQLPNLQLAEEKKIEYQYQHSDFFKDQLTAFEVYLDQGAKEQKEPEQLPIVLQVLLSQVHRLRALVLLARFLDLGPWAVNLALSIGIFPYVLKLLQSQAQDLKPPLVFIWARVLAVDQECQNDLLKDNGYQYFVSILNPNIGLSVTIVSEHRAMCAFIVAMFCHNHKQGQLAAATPELINSCLGYISWVAVGDQDKVDNPGLRQWSVLCLSTLWKDNTTAKRDSIKMDAHKRLFELTQDPVAEVRTAMVHALTTFIGIPHLTEQVAAIEEEIALRLLPMTKDGCSIVRKEVTVFLSTFVARYFNRFVVTALEHAYDEIEPVLLQDLAEEEADMEQDSESGNPTGYPSKNTVLRSKSSNVLGDPSSQALRVRNLSENTLVEGESHSKARKQAHFSLAESPSDAKTIKSSSTEPPSEASRPRKPRNINDKLSKDAIYSAVWMQLLVLAVDPDVQVAQNAQIIIRAVARTCASEIGDMASLIFWYYREYSLGFSKSVPASSAQFQSFAGPSPPDFKPPQRSDSYLSAGMRRTASVAASLANLAFGGTTHEEVHSSLPEAPSVRDERSIERAPSPYSNSETTQSHDGLGPKTAKYPAPEWFQDIDHHKRISIPLESEFFDYAVEYFREHQMKQTEDEEPGSRDYNERLWRRNRNEKILEYTQKMKEQAGSSRWDHQSGYFNNSYQPWQMCFHQYENHLVIAGDKSTVHIWDWEQRKSLNRFSNGNMAGSKMTGVRLINEDDQALLMIGSSDGAVRIFKNYEIQGKTQVLSAFNATPKPDPIAHNHGLILDWLQGRGLILAAGDAKAIRVWNASTETLIHEIRLIPKSQERRSVSKSCVTSMTSDQVECHTIVAGFDDGSVRVYDQRLDPYSAMVKSWSEHDTNIARVRLQRGGQRELVSASRDGKVKLWDLRMNQSLRTVSATKDTLRTLSVHERAPVFAVGSERHKIKVFNMDGDFLSSFEPLSLSRQQSRAAPIVATAFHPHRMMLACASLSDTYVTLYSCADAKKVGDRQSIVEGAGLELGLGQQGAFGL